MHTRWNCMPHHAEGISFAAAGKSAAKRVGRHKAGPPRWWTRRRSRQHGAARPDHSCPAWAEQLHLHCASGMPPGTPKRSRSIWRNLSSGTCAAVVGTA